MIESVITDVETNLDGTATIVLNGKARITIVNPPKHFDACIGTTVSGRHRTLIVGGVKWAEAVAPYRMKLVKPPAKRKPANLPV